MADKDWNNIPYTDGDCVRDENEWNDMVTDIRNKPCTYLIYREDDVYYALNGTTGNVDSSNTDARTVIQYAIDQSTDGGLITLKQGTYVITNAIELTSDIWLRGEGWGTILERSGTWAKHHIITNKTIATYTDNNICISDLYIKDNATGTSFPNGIHLQKVTNCFVYNVYIKESEAHAVEFYACKWATCRDCYSDNVGDDGFQSDSTLTDRAEHNRWINCYAKTPGQMGIKLENQGHIDIIIRGCTIISPTTVGIGGISPTGEYTDIIIENNYIYQAAQPSIQFVDLKGGRINNNWIIEPLHRGIFIQGNTYDTDAAYGFVIEENHIIGGSNYGMFLTNCKYFQVINNYFENNTTKEMAIYESVHGVISNNVINSNVIGINLYDGGNGCVDNIITGNMLDRCSTGILEANNGDWNIITSNNGRGCTNSVTTVGGNTVTANNL